VSEVTLSRVQTKLYDATERFRFIVSGRRVGKTIWLLVELFIAACKRPRGISWYIAPTYTQARDIAWQPILDLIDPRYIRKINTTRMQITLHNGHMIAFKGVDNPDSLRGRGLDFAAMDEYSMYEKDVFPMIIRPMLAISQGRACFGMTPMGYNHAYDMYANIMSGAFGDEWKAWSYTTAEGGFVPEAEIIAAKRDLDPRIYRQEYEASFETLAGRVYDQFERRVHVNDSLVDPGGTLVVGMDFNINPMSAIVATQVGDLLCVHETIQLETSNTDEMAQMLRARYTGREIIVCPDPSGRARKTSAAAGVTDFTLLEMHGMTLDAPNVAPMIKDRINAVQMCWRQKKIIVHPRCEALIRSMEGLTYKEGTNLPDKASGLDHMADALGYLVWQRNNPLHAAWGSTRVAI
jgi:phage terminase large subunit